MGVSDSLERYSTAADGLRLYYRDYPPTIGDESRLPVICLHGLTRNSRDFGPIAEVISTSRRVIVPDMRGRGGSEYDTDWHNYHPYQYVADVWNLLDELGVSELIAFGTSMGGWMAAIMAHEQPGRIRGGIINDIGPAIDPSGLARIQASAGLLPATGSWDEAVAATKQNYGLALPDLDEATWRWYTESTYRDLGGGRLDMNFDRAIGDATRAGVSGLRDDPWTLFDALENVPMLVLRGELSDILAQATLDAMHARYPQMTSAVIANRGHPPLLDEPDAVAAIAEFLNRVP